MNVAEGNYKTSTRSVKQIKQTGKSKVRRVSEKTTQTPNKECDCLANRKSEQSLRNQHKAPTRSVIENAQESFQKTIQSRDKECDWK